jgi:hypothetical protein
MVALVGLFAAGKRRWTDEFSVGSEQPQPERSNTQVVALPVRRLL